MSTKASLILKQGELDAAYEMCTRITAERDAERQRAEALEIEVVELRTALERNRAAISIMAMRNGTGEDLLLDALLARPAPERGAALLAVVEAACDLVIEATDVGGEGPMPWNAWQALRRAVRALLGGQAGEVEDSPEPHPYDRACRHTQHSGCTCMHLVNGRWCGKPRLDPIHVQADEGRA